MCSKHTMAYEQIYVFCRVSALAEAGSDLLESLLCRGIHRPALAALK